MQAVASRLVREGRLRGPLPAAFTGPADGPMDAPRTVARPLVERPPHETLRAVA
jgi:hypothetical protein